MNTLIDVTKSLNIDCCGFCRYNGQVYFVCLFPYYTGDLPDFRMSRYARIVDYHTVARSYLQKIAELGGVRCEIFVDKSGLPERYLAVMAGLGFIGENKCLINDIYGSYVFIGGLILNEDIEFIPLETVENKCGGCDICTKACPDNVLAVGDFARCVSHLTQSKRINEKTTLPSIWGCDICQEICPKNKNIKITPIAEFHDSILNNISVEGLSNSEFVKKYGKYPFAYKGKKIIERNINILE